MFKSLQIKNFQSHKNTFVEFSPNVTCFTGNNNHGKSVILRALLKVIRNNPDGVSFITDTPFLEQECSIILVTDKGKVERRIKRGNVTGNNMYIVNDVLEFSNFSKTGIPKEVLEILEVSDPIEFGGADIDLNFQNQFDMMFLTQGDGLASLRGKVLGKVTNIDDVNRAIQIGASEEKTLKKEINVLQSSIEKNKQEQGLFKDLYLQEQQVKNIKEFLNRGIDLQNVIEQVSLKKEEVVDIVKNAKAYRVKLDIITKIDVNAELSLIENLKRKISLLKDIIVLQQKLSHFTQILGLQIPINQDLLNERFLKTRLLINIIELQAQLQLLKRNADISVNVNLQLLFNLYARHSNLYFLLQLHQQISLNLSQFHDQQIEESKVDQEYTALKNELKICPTCGKPF
jgi:exonuclease SbcC